MSLYQNLSYDENEHHDRVRRPLISKFEYSMLSEIFIFDFDRFFLILTEK